jgi:IS30 family transposase
MTKAYQQLTYEQRCQISALKKRRCTQRDIAAIIGTSQPTVSRELARNTGKKGYRHKQAQMNSDQRRVAAVKPTKMIGQMIDFVESKLRLEWRPEQISDWLLEVREQLLSHETIYLHIWANKREGGDLYTYLRRQGKKYDKRRNGKSTRGQIKNRISIDDRPDIVADKARIGDWEIDTMIGKGHSGALVTIAERVTNFTVLAQVDNKSANDVTKATIALLTPFKDVVHTITADNGKEFAYHEEISEKLLADVYFAHPYSSWERGLNENTNGLLRQYFPKKIDLKTVTQIEVGRAVQRLNSRPRKNLDYKTPDQLMSAHRAALAA